MLFADSMSIADRLINGLGVTILGMLVVFAVLIILSYALDVLRIFAGQNDKKKSTPSEEIVKTENVSNATNATENTQDDEEIIAVISAAIANLSGTSVEDIFIKSIKPAPQKNNIWATVGRQERMLERL